MVNGFAVCAFGVIINHRLIVPHTGGGNIVGLVYQEHLSSAEIVNCVGYSSQSF